MKLLIVDDHEMNLRLLRAKLEIEGHQVVDACDGVEALEKLDAGNFDGVISDILMPRMDGYRLCIELRKHPRLAATAFVLYTSTYNSPGDRKLAETVGADAYISKPAPTEQLLDALRAARARTRPAPEVAAEPDTPILKEYNQVLVRKLEEKGLELERTYEGLVESRARLAGLIETAMDAIIAVDEQYKIILFNRAAGEMFLFDPAEALGLPLDQFIPIRSRDLHRVQMEAFGRGDGAARRMGPREVTALRSDGMEFPIEANISLLSTSQGPIYTVFIRDITARRQAEERINGLNRMYAVLSGINSLIVRVQDREDLLREACRIIVGTGGFTRVWVGTMASDAAPPELVSWAGGDDLFFRTLQQQLLEGKVVIEAGVRAILAEGDAFVSNDILADPRLPKSLVQGVAGSRSLAILPLREGHKSVALLALHAPVPGFFDSEELRLLGELARDISFALEHLGQSDRINYLSHHDALTGLPNRRVLVENLQSRLAQNAGAPAPCVAMLDMVRFGRVNETLGREQADALLLLVSRRLQAMFPGVSRIGGDVFAFEATGFADEGEGWRELESLIARVFAEPFEVGAETLRMGFRLGIAGPEIGTTNADGLLANAEAALRHAKRNLESAVLYQPGMNATANEALVLESRLRGAVERGEFVLHYQAKVDLEDGRICGAEALIRWQDPERGLISPMQFIPVLEETGLIEAVGNWALRQALADQNDWKQAGARPIRVAVNVSPRQLNNPRFSASVAEIVQSFGADALELEITESVIMEDVDRKVRMLQEIRDLGVTVAVDDFGTGYSSLAYIARLPITTLKIDRTFISGMTGIADQQILVGSIVALAHALNFEVVAEGVETEVQAMLLRRLSCDSAQGYHFGRPVPAAEFKAVLQADPRLGV